MPRTLPVGEVLRCEDGYALVVAALDADRYTAMADLLTYAYGGTWERGNAVIEEAAEALRIETWHSCTKRYREAMGVEEDAESWWAADGDGARTIVVAYHDNDGLYDLGDLATKAAGLWCDEHDRPRSQCDFFGRTHVVPRPRCPEHDMPDCSPLLNGCTWRPEVAGA